MSVQTVSRSLTPNSIGLSRTKRKGQYLRRPGSPNVTAKKQAKLGYGDRIFAGLLSYQSVHGRTSLEAVGERVATLEKRAKPYSKAAVSDWMNERSEPSLRTFMALARLFGGMPSWYAFNFGEAPENPVATHAAAYSPQEGKKRGRG